MVSGEQQVIQIIKQARINFLATLPCDRIKKLLPLVQKKFEGIELTREEDGLGICAGAWLAGARPMMMIQSTGIGNMLGAFFSLNIASHIPLPVFASFRGFYKEGIDSQIPFGRNLPAILRAGGIYCSIIDTVEKLPLLSTVIQDAFDHCRLHVALVSPRVWENAGQKTCQEDPPTIIRARSAENIEPLCPVPVPLMTRYDAIKNLSRTLEDQIVVSNLGVPSKELFDVCDRPLNYYMLGSMGLASSIGFGISRFSDRKVMVLEGDGSILMNPNALITIGQHQPANLMIIALDNACYGSTGSQRTYTQDKMDLEYFARSCGFKNTVKIHEPNRLSEVIYDFERQGELSFIHVILKPGNSDSPNISMPPGDITKRFKACLEA